MRRKFKAKTLVELLAKVYKAHGWIRERGESRSKRVAAIYDIEIEGNSFVAVCKVENGLDHNKCLKSVE